tara:strand:+ start:212 stop:604 length:393 start_codon:yes stop_codon:yes gene_type:complete
MSIFEPINENKAKGKVKKIFADIKKTRSIKKIPNFWRSIAHNPELLERTWDNLKQIMRKGSLDPVTKELIYVAVSITNSCEYCIRSHTAAAKKKGATDQMIKEMIDVVGIANQNNKLVEAYQVEVDKIYR